MFITLRTSGTQNEPGGMEQVARRNAGPGGSNSDRVRGAIRRPACVACQTKKLRCTGSPRNCDQCRTKLIECVFPTSSDQDKRRAYSSQSSSSSRPAWPGSSPTGEPPRAASSEDGVNGPNLGPSDPPQQPGIAGELTALAGVDPLDGDFFDLDIVENFDVDMDYLAENGDSVEAQTRPSMGYIHGGSNNTYHQPNKSPQHSYDALASFQSGAQGQAKVPGPQGQPRTNPNTSAQEIPSSLALDTTPLPPAQSRAVPRVPPPSSLNWAPSPACSCLSDLIRVVQQLDDDEFHITTLALDQVLQLQKWIVFQCCKVFDCPNCVGLSTVHTVRLIICDRLTEMFECIHKRIKRACAILTGQSSDSSSQLTSSQSPDSQSASSQTLLHPVPQPPAAAVGSGPTPAQLFCASSGSAANTASCNAMMFSDEFRNQYSDEEQVHMIRVLLKLHIRYFHQLLLRLERTNQAITANQARQSKVKSMIVRLAKASADIDGSLRDVLNALSFA